MDELEMDRINMAHAKYFILLDKRRWIAPIPANPHKVLDLACGTDKFMCLYSIVEVGCSSGIHDFRFDFTPRVPYISLPIAFSHSAALS